MTSSGAQSRKLFLAVAVSCGVMLGGGALVYVFPSASNQGYNPEQPIPFSHKKHAGEFKIPCMYCHVGAEKSRHAVIPSLNVCMNCHNVVKTDSPHIKKIQEAYKANQPIEWVRIHELPDHVNFVHSRHVQKGISCQTCHGPVEQMERVYQHSALTMGWCLDCHRGKTTPSHVLKQAYPGVKSPRGRQVANISCVTCHQ